MKSNIAIAALLISLTVNSQALVTVGDDSLFAGYIQGNNYVGVNHKADIKVIPVAVDKLDRKVIEDIYDCEFKSLGGENVAFFIRIDEKGTRDAVCAPAPAGNYRRAWEALMIMKGIK